MAFCGPQPSDTPCHVLMVTPEADDSQQHQPKPTMVALDRRLRRDYVSKRYLTFHRQQQEVDKNKDPKRQVAEEYNEGDPFWMGSSNLEKSLVSCCEIASTEEQNGDINISMATTVIRGALARDAVLRFVELLTMQCHSLASRTLALAILERSREADEAESVPLLMDTATSDLSNEQPPTKKSRTTRNGGNSTTTSDGEEAETKATAGDTSPRGGKRPDGRLIQFLGAGGLRILNKWLADATTPVPAPVPKKPPPGSTEASQPQKKQRAEHFIPSETGPLLAPLLALLERIPFDRKLVMQSNINKQIRDLNRKLEGIIRRERAKQTKLKSHTDPASGGLPVVEVQKALSNLKRSWEEQNKANLMIETPDPFEGLKRQLRDRLDTLNKYHQGEEGLVKPQWLIKIEEARKQKDDTQKNEPSSKKPPPRTALLARKERENERADMMKESLRKAKEERAALLRKLRELQHKATVDEQQRERDRRQSEKRIRWKDGLTTSKQRIRSVLEEVFEYSLDQDEQGETAEQADVTNTGENESSTTDIGERDGANRDSKSLDSTLNS